GQSPRHHRPTRHTPGRNLHRTRRDQPVLRRPHPYTRVAAAGPHRPARRLRRTEDHHLRPRPAPRRPRRPAPHHSPHPTPHAPDSTHPPRRARLDLHRGTRRPPEHIRRLARQQRPRRQGRAPPPLPPQHRPPPATPPRRTHWTIPHRPPLDRRTQPRLRDRP